MKPFRVLSPGLILAGLLTSLLTACLATGGSPGGTEQTPAQNEADTKKADARRLADLDSARASWGLVTNPTLDTYLNGLLERIKETVPNGPRQSRVYVIPQPQTDAQTTAGGNIFLSMGWIRSVKSEDELIALLAHEYGHVVFKHHSSDAVGDMGSLSRTAYLLKVIAAKATPGMASDFALGIWDQAAHPAWKRDQEREADAFALETSVTLRQSYPDGMKAFLERVREWESRVDSAKPAGQGTTSMKDTHPRAEERLADVQGLLADKFPNRVRGKSHKAEWQAILATPDVKSLMARYKSVVQAREFLAAGNSPQGLKLARSAAEGNGMSQSWVVVTLAEALIRNGQADQGTALLRQAVDAPEANPQAASLLTQAYLAGNRPMEAKAVIDHSFERLGKPEVMYPEVIGVYRAVLDRLPANQFDSTRVALAKTALTAQCVVFPAYKDSCIFAGMSVAERAAHDSAQLAKQKKMEQDVGKTVEKLFKK